MHSTFSHVTIANPTSIIPNDTSLILHPTASLAARMMLATSALTTAADGDPSAADHPFCPELSGIEIVQVITHEIAELDK